MLEALPGRRERVREATFREIKDVARGILVQHGRQAVSVNAVARQMKISGPALYRYFASYDELIASLTSDFFQELTADIVAAREEADRAVAPLLVMSRAMRKWAISHPQEFGLVFASPLPSMTATKVESAASEAGEAFGRLFLDEVSAIWHSKRFPVPDLDEMAPAHADQLRAYATQIGNVLPPEAAHVFLSCWIRLYGLLCMEVLQQLEFALRDVEPFYEECLEQLCQTFGLEYGSSLGRPLLA